MLCRYIKTKRLSNKLDFKKLRLFKIARKVREVNYKVELLNKSRLHLIFYISLLELVKGNVPINYNTKL